MSRRGQNGVAFSLFAFQDIITSVTGIMILVTLILALELLQQMEASPSQRTKEVVQDIDSTVTSVTELDAAVARNQARIADLQDRLTQGAGRIGDVAGFDQRAVQQENAEQTRRKVQGLTDVAERQKEINDAAQEIKDHEETLKNAQQSLAEAERKLQQEIESRSKAAKLPKGRATTKTEIPLFLRAGRLCTYVRDTGNGLAINQAEIDEKIYFGASEEPVVVQ